MTASEHDKYRPLTAAAVLLVTGIAATVSYMHVRDLALVYGQPPLAAYLLPLSIDGMVATSSLVLLRSARAGISSPWLARTGLALAIAATLVANVASGLPDGWPAAVMAGWPAVAFVFSAETAIALSRRAARRAKAAAELSADGERTVRTADSKPQPKVAKRTVTVATVPSERTQRRHRAKARALADATQNGHGSM